MQSTGPELTDWLAHHSSAFRGGRWLVTGAAGFIGSHLVEALISAGAEVTGLDDFSTGSRATLETLCRSWSDEQNARFRFIEGDIRKPEDCAEACTGVRWVLHQAALGSVPRSITDPLATHRVNVDGFLQMLLAAKAACVERFVYASSSSVYGDEPALPKVEHRVGSVLSPYAASKRTNESYATAFAAAYGMRVTGLRYFNVFGPRQDPHGPYAAVIPRWLDAMTRGDRCLIHGDGETSRDFCFVANVVMANLLAATAAAARAPAEVFNVACGEQTTLRQLYAILRDEAREVSYTVADLPDFGPFRAGDIRHSLADTTAIASALGYRPLVKAHAGLGRTARAYFASPSSPTASPAS